MNKTQVILLSMMVGTIVPVAYAVSKTPFEIQDIPRFVVTAEQP